MKFKIQGAQKVGQTQVGQRIPVVDSTILGFISFTLPSFASPFEPCEDSWVESLPLAALRLLR